MDNELRKGNMIPGSCDEFTQPEEIEALSKFLGNVRKVYDENTKLEEDKLGVFGRSNIKETEALSRNLDRIGISQKERFSQLSEEVDKIKNNKEVPLSNRVENLRDQRNSKLEDKIKKLILGGNTVSSLSAEVESLRNIEDDKLKLSEAKDTLSQPGSLSGLSKKVDRITDTEVDKLSSTKQELQNSSPVLDSLGSKVKDTLNSTPTSHLVSEKESLKVDKEADTLSNSISRINNNSEDNIKSLSDQVSKISISGDDLELVKRKKKDTTKEDDSPKQKLSNKLEKLRDEGNVESLNKDRENLVVSSKINLVTEKNKLKTNDIVEDLEKKTVNLDSGKDIKSLSDQVSKISISGDELSLSNTVETLSRDSKNLKLEEEREKLVSNNEIEKLEGVEETLPNNSNNVAQLSEKVDKIVDETNINLSSYYDRLETDSRVDELPTNIDKLSLGDDNSVKSLSKDIKQVEGEQKKVASLSSNITKINTNKGELRLSAHKEELENNEGVETLDENPRKTIPELKEELDSLSENVDNLINFESAQVDSLADQVSEKLSINKDVTLATNKEILGVGDNTDSLSFSKESLSNKQKSDPELENEVIEKLEIKENITSLVSEKERIVGQASDDNELSGKVVILDDSGAKGDQDLSSVVEKITDDTSINLSGVKESITPKEDQELSEKRELIEGIEEVSNLSDTKINISDTNEPSLSDFIDELEQEDDSELSDVVEKITDDTSINLSGVKESITPKEDQELSEVLKNAPENANTNKWDEELSDKRLDITLEDSENGDPELENNLLKDNELTKKDITDLSSVKKSTPTNINSEKEGLYDTYIDINGDSVARSENAEVDEDFEVDEGSLSSEYINTPKDSVSEDHEQFNPDSDKLAKEVNESLKVPSSGGRKSDAQELESTITRTSSLIPEDDTKKEGHEEGRFSGENLYNSILGPTEDKVEVGELNLGVEEGTPKSKNVLDPDERSDEYKASKLTPDNFNKSYKESILGDEKEELTYAKKNRKPLAAHHENNSDGTESTKDVSTFQSDVIDAVESRIEEDSYYQKILKLASITNKPDNGIDGTPGLMAKIASLASAYLSGGEITKERYKEYESKLFEAVAITKEVSGYQNTPINQGGEVTELKGKNRSALGSLVMNTSGIANVPSTKLPAFNLGAINLNNYLRFTAEKSIGNIKFLQGTARKVLLDETLDALIYARDVLEKLTKANRDRLPGNDNGLLSSAVSGGLKGFATTAVGAIFGGSSINTDNPLNRPKTKGINSSREGNNWEERDSFTGLSNKFESAYDTSTGGKGQKISVNSKIDDGSVGITTTMEELCGVDAGTIGSVEALMSTLEKSPYITTASKFTSTSSKPYKVMSLDSNNYWEIIFEPFVGEENGNKSYLPSIDEINMWNSVYHGIFTDYTRWLPILSFDLSKSKMTTKTLGLFDGEISYPVSMEFTNELKLTFADDQYKSLRTYFERCVDASIYSSEVHDKNYYNGASGITKIDKTYTHVAFYKNVTFRCTIYSMTPQKSTVSKYDLLVVIKDFTEERSGEIEGGGTDLTVSFSIVGENPSNARTMLKEDVVNEEKGKLGDRGENELGAGSKIASVAKKAVSGILKAL